VAPATQGWDSANETLGEAESVVAFSVTDTGIGIREDKHNLIFEAFQQANTGTSRKYGGTGLGLSISREIVAMLGGEIRLLSQPGTGSRFTVFLPVSYLSPKRRSRGEPPATAFPASAVAEPTAPPAAPRAAPAQPPASPDLKAPSPEPLGLSDDRAGIRPGERVLLIVEDDAKFAAVLTDLARKHGFKSLVATTAASALSLAREFNPAAITLDLHLPDWDGWVVLDRLKHDPYTSNIPVHVISVEDDEERSLKSGAFGHLKKPVTREALDAALDKIKEISECALRNLLVVENDPSERQHLLDLVGNGDVQTAAT